MINRKLKPDSSESILFSLPEMQEETLSNGLKIVYIQKRKLPISRMNLMTRAGSKFDPNNQKGLSNLLSMEIDEGAGGMTSLEISDAFDTLGANFSVNSDSESVNLKLQTLTENLESSLDIFSKILLKPDFRSQDFEREKRKILTKLLQLSDEPDFIAQRILEFLAFQENNSYAYPTLGYTENIETIQNEHIKQFYSQKFTPAFSHLVAVGNLDFSKFVKVIESHFQIWNSASDPTELIFNENLTAKKIFIYDKKDSVQSEIRVGHPSVKRNSYNFFPRMILNTILGGQFSSRINLNLRENKGYTYGAFSSFSYFKDAALFYVSTSVGIDNTIEATNEIYKELDNILNGVTDAEMNFAKSSIIKKFPSNFETYRQITSNLASKVIHSLPDDFFNTYIENVSNVTKEQVNKAAEELIKPEEAFCVLVADKNKLIDSLKTTKMEIVEVDDKGKMI